MEISGGTMKNDDISAAAFRRFISRPASGRSSALPLLAVFLVLSKISEILHLHSLFSKPTYLMIQAKQHNSSFIIPCDRQELANFLEVDCLLRSASCARKSD